jgi:hypothetical protein
MDLRPELLPPPVSPERIDELSEEIERICGLLDRRSPDDGQVASVVADFNAMTGHGQPGREYPTSPGTS